MNLKKITASLSRNGAMRPDPSPLAPLRRCLMQAMAAAPLAGSLPASAAGDVVLSGPVKPFTLADVRLLDGPFRQAQQRDLRYLESLNPDRLLHYFHKNAGLPPKAPVYGGWESEQLCPGHTLGHYLSASAMMWAATGSATLRDNVDYLVRELHACQQASGSGLVCGFPDGDAQLRNCLEGRKVIGVPWYTIHKIMAGLRDAQLYALQPQALPVLARMADWVDEAVRPLDDARFQNMLDLEHGGMNELLADVHVLTGEPRYLRLAERFTHRVILDPLAEGRDNLDGQHANTTIPKVLGFARLHAVTGQPHYQRAASYFWGTVVENRSFATGGHGENEFFYPGADARKHLSSAKTMETCCIYNMLRLTQALFAAAPNAAYGDYAERALLNGILGSQDPDSGMFTYFQATRPNYPKIYCTPEHSFWCCTGTGMENHAKYGDAIYFHTDEALYVNLYIASELHWADRKLRLRQDTRFPDQGATRLTLQLERPATLALRLRHPGWCKQLTVRLNGRTISDSGRGGRYVEIQRTWRDGDVLEVDMPMHLHLAPMPGAPDFAAILYGPVVLAARLGRDGMQPGADLSASNRAYGVRFNQERDMPALRLGTAGIDALVRRIPGPGLAFQLGGAGLGAGFDLIPYHRIAHERYNLYWNIAAPGESA